MKVTRRSFLSMLAGALAVDPSTLTGRQLTPPRVEAPPLDDLQAWRMWDTVTVQPGSGVYRFFGTPAHAGNLKLALRGYRLALPEDLTVRELYRLQEETAREKLRVCMRVDGRVLARCPWIWGSGLGAGDAFPIDPQIVLPLGKEFSIEAEAEDLEIKQPLRLHALLDGVLLR